MTDNEKQEQGLEDVDLEALGAEALGEDLPEEEEIPELQETEAPDPGGSYGFDLGPQEGDETVIMTSEPNDLVAQAVSLLERAGFVVSAKTDRDDLTQEGALKSARDQKKSRIAQVLRRGRVNSKVDSILEKHVPEDRAGKLVRNTPDDIAAHEALGFTLVHSDDPDGMHGSADGTIRVGDTVLMSISREDQSIIREIRAERVKQNVGGRAQEEFMSKSPQGFDESKIEIGGRS